jgi:hypothetical protein
MRILHEIFGFEQAVTRGERLHLRFFELFIVLWALRFGWVWAEDIQPLSDVVVPLGVARFIDISFMFGPVMPRLNAILLTALLGAGFLRVWRPAYALALVSFHLQYAARDVLGEISHGTNLVGTAIAGLALGALLLRDAIQQRRFGFGFTVLFTAIGYTSAGFCKLIATGPRWVDGHHLMMWINERSVDAIGKWGEVSHNALQRLALDNWWAATLILGIGILTELSSILAIFRRFRPYVFGAVIGMHLGIWAVMDILFDVNVYLLVVIAFPWAQWLEKLPVFREVAEPIRPSAFGP